MTDLLKIVIVLGLIGLSVSCGVMRYNECRRYHPTWYCMSGKS